MAECLVPEEDLLPSIRQLITSIAPSIRASGSLSAAEALLFHLEETDENFHRYEFVKFIKNKIEDVLGPLIDEELEKRTVDMQNKGSEEALIQSVTSHIITDQACTDMLQSLKISTKNAVDRLIQLYDNEQRQSRPYDSEQRNAGKTTVMSSNSFYNPRTNSYSDDSSSLDSSFNQSGFVFMNQEHFISIAENLEPSNPLDVRRDAMQSLMQIPPSDVVACEQWDKLKKGLLVALGDEDEFLAEKSLRFHARMFSSNSHNVMREVYISLVQHLTMCFSSRQPSVPRLLKDGVDFSDPDTELLLKKFRLMNEFQIEAESFWVRFPEKFVEDITEVTFDLLATCPTFVSGSYKPLTPSHYLAIIDPKATWFKTWMHGNYSRTSVIDLVKNHIHLIEDAVVRCLEFVASRNDNIDAVSVLTQRLQRQQLGSAMRTKYTAQEVKFFCFYHWLCMLGCLLLYKKGRELFPIQLDNKQVYVTDFLVQLVSLIINHSEPTHLEDSGLPHVSGNPAELVTETLKILTTSQSACKECLLKDSLINELLKPVRNWLHHGKPTNEATMIYIADVISAIASWEGGRRLLLYGENNHQQQPNKSAAFHAIAEFAKEALDSPMDSSLDIRPPRSVAGVYLFICRQLYNSCEGLMALYPYRLHYYVANAWTEASRESEMCSTPTMDDDSMGEARSSDNASQKLLLWEQTLIDNLLNFAGTPKGLLLLQQTGAVNESVAFMHCRYANKLQVSKTEKFGYGTMVTQIASTAPGMMALQSSGFITALVHGVWSNLECGREDKLVLQPMPHPVQPIDRSVHKFFVSLVNVLSAFPAVYEILVGQPLANKETYSFREMPDTLHGLIDRIVIVNSETKLHYLFNVEQSCMFGLRLLCFLICCLDTMLLLETQYKIWDYLLDEQTSNKHDESGEIIIDSLSVERNHILVRSYVVGGPSERVLPGRSLSDDVDDVYPWPMFTSFPVPKYYQPTVSRPSAVKIETNLTKFLSEKEKMEKPELWVERCQELFCQTLKERPESINGKVLSELLEQVIGVQQKLTEYQAFPLKPCNVTDNAVKAQKLSSLQVLGIKLAIRYGQHLKGIPAGNNMTENLTLLLKKCKYFLQGQQRNLDSDIRCLQGGYPGYDWFASTMFVLLGGNRDRTWVFLHQFSSLLVSGFLWMPRLHASVHMPVELAVSGIHPVFSTTGFNIELILQMELPQLLSAFRLSGYTPSQICQQWLRQCFWNFLDWSEICLYVLVCTLMGADYQVYYCVAILKYLEPQILVHTQQQQLQFLLKEESLGGFHLADHIDFMKSLARKFRSTVLKDMRTLNKA